MDAGTVSRQVIYSGRVQGVGFRMTARRLARRFPVTGHVRNLPDGTVQLVVQGEVRSVGEFLDAVAGAMESCIDRTEVTPAQPNCDAVSFEIVD